MDKTRPSREQNLVEWARPYLNDARKLSRIMDSTLDGMYPTKATQRAAAMAHQCLSQRPKSRPPMSAIVEALEPLLELNDEMVGSFVFTVVPGNGVDKEREKKDFSDDGSHCEGEKRKMWCAKSAIHTNLLLYRNSSRHHHRNESRASDQDMRGK